MFGGERTAEPRRRISRLAEISAGEGEGRSEGDWGARDVAYELEGVVTNCTGR